MGGGYLFLNLEFSRTVKWTFGTSNAGVLNLYLLRSAASNYGNSLERLSASNLALAFRASQLVLAIYYHERENPEGRQICELTTVFQFANKVVISFIFLLVSLIKHQSPINYISSTLTQFFEFVTYTLIAIFVFFISVHKVAVFFNSFWSKTKCNKYWPSFCPLYHRDKVDLRLHEMFCQFSAALASNINGPGIRESRWIIMNTTYLNSTRKMFVLSVAPNDCFL